MSSPVRNWAGNVRFGADELLRPTDVGQVQELVAGARRLRVLGTGHSFNRLADTDGDLLTVAGLDPALHLDEAAREVSVSGGVRYAELNRFLHEHGYALPNLGSLPHISVAGACSTATHGSGAANRCLAASVAGLDVVRADGELVTHRRGDAGFDGAVVALGALGVVTTVRLSIVPVFDIRQRVWLGGSVAALAEDPGSVLDAGYSVSAFVRPGGPDPTVQLWVKSRAEDPEPDLGVLGAHPADQPVHMIAGADPSACTPQLGTCGPSHTRLPHFRAEFRPSHGDEQQSEYFVSRADAGPALRALARLDLGPTLLVSEIRAVAADEMWLSPFHGRDSLALHFTWINDDVEVARAVRAVEAALDGFDVRPHWGKVFDLAPDRVRAAYPRLEQFRDLVAHHDPDRIFGNDFLTTYIYR